MKEYLERLLFQKQNFVCYRLPSEEEAVILAGRMHEQLLTSPLIDGFHFAPFSHDEDRHRVLEPTLKIPYPVPPVCPVTDDREHRGDALSPDFDTPEATADYRQAFSRCLHELRKGTLGKVVLSRSRSIETSANRILNLFSRAMAAFPHAFVYLFHTPATGIWLGATPELLIRLHSERFESMALAGTMSHTKGTQLSSWSQKDRTEQAVVCRFLSEAFRACGLQPALSLTYPHLVGSLCHLRTDISADLPAGADFKAVLSDLTRRIHPSPAVSGFPQAEALRLIRSVECRKRRYYCGYLGLVDGVYADLFVNLRCLNFDGDVATFYAGGGLMPASDVAAEWFETRSKLRSLSSLL